MSHDQISAQEREDVLIHELGLLAHDPGAPASTVDIPRAVHTARGRLRRRRIRRAGVAVVLAAAVALGATMLPGLHHAPPAQRHGSGMPRDPLVANVRFTWLPSGFAVTLDTSGEMATGLYDTRAEAARPVPGTPWAPAMADLYVYPKGVDPAVRGAVDKSRYFRLAAPDVNGRPAYWMSQLSDHVYSFGLLRWLTPDGRWAEIRYMYWNQKSVTTDLLRMADGAVFEDSPQPMPFYVEGLSPGTTVDSVMQGPGPARRGWNPGEWSSEVGFDLQGTNFTVTVGNWPKNPSGEVPAAQTVTPNGVGFVQSCSTADHLNYCIESFLNIHHVPPALAALGGMTGLLRLVHPLGTNPADWTTDVIR